MPTFTPYAGSPFGSLSAPAAPPTPPTPTVISTAVGSLFADVPSVEIAFSDALVGPWTVQEHCYLDRLREVAAPEVSQASLTWLYGSVLQPGETSFATVEPLAVAGKRVRIKITNNWEEGTTNLGDWNADTNTPSLVSGGSGEADGSFYTVSDAGNEDLDGIDDWEVGDVLIFRDGVWTRLTHVEWYGIVANETLNPDGNANDISSGKQSLTCYGLLYDAERKQITTTVLETKDGALTGDTITINRGLAFNTDQRGELAEHGNRSEDELAPLGTLIGSWNAATNNPTLVSSVGTEGDYYSVSTTGTTDLDGTSDWTAGDFVLFRGGQWKHGYSDTTYAFSYRERGKDEWNAEQAVEYLLEHQNPGPVTAVINDDAGNLDWLPKGGVETDRRTVKAVLDELIQRQRGIGYHVTFDPRDEQVKINVFTFADVPINMPNGTTLNANPNQYSLDFESSFDVVAPELNNTITTKYHKVVVEGDWRTVTCTLSLNPSAYQLVTDWTPAEQQAYFDAASRESWYAALPLAEKVSANQKARSEDKFDHVFARFKVSDDWDLLSHDPENTSDTERVFAVIDPWNANGEFDDADCASWISGLQLLDHLPLRERFDYSDDHIDDDDWKYTVTDLDDRPPFLKPFSFALTNVPRFPTWELLDRIDGDSLAAPDKRKWSISTRSHHDRAAVMLSVSGGHQQFFANDDWHTIGFTNQGNWNAATNSPSLASGVGTEGDYYICTVAHTLRELDGVTNWKVGDRLFFHEDTWRRAPAASDSAAYPGKNHALNYSTARVTLTFEMTERTRIERQIILASTGEQERVLRIPVKDCRLDYVVPNTVVGITNGVLQKTTGGFVRDDRERLDTFAKAAAEWYGPQRQTIDLGFKQVRKFVSLGDLIVDVGSTYQKTSVRSVVTSITYDIKQKSTSLQTSYAELDLA